MKDKFTATVTRTTVWSDGQTLTAAALNGEFNNLLNAPAIVNADISGSAAIAVSKLAGTPSGTGNLLLQTNPTITKPTVNGSVLGTQTYTPQAAGTATLDLSLANINYITMPAGNITIALSNASVGQAFVIRILQDSGGSRTVTWFTTIKWQGGVTPLLTTTANKADTFGFICTSSNNYDGYVVGQNL